VGEVGVYLELTNGYPGVTQKNMRQAQFDTMVGSEESLAGTELGVLVRLPAG
jgi:hypothetical protein